MFRILSRFGLAMLLVCLSQGTIATEASTIPPDFSMRLTRGACEGPCPIYSISVDSKGKVRWRGERFVRTKGQATKVVAAATLHTIIRRARELRILSLGPGTISTIDASLTEIELGLDGRWIHVAYCIDDVSPQGRRLNDFALFVDQALADQRWVGGAEYRRMQ